MPLVCLFMLLFFLPVVTLSFIHPLCRLFCRSPLSPLLLLSFFLSSRVAFFVVCLFMSYCSLLGVVFFSFSFFYSVVVIVLSFLLTVSFSYSSVTPSHSSVVHLSVVLLSFQLSMSSLCRFCRSSARRFVSLPCRSSLFASRRSGPEFLKHSICSVPREGRRPHDFSKTNQNIQHRI